MCSFTLTACATFPTGNSFSDNIGEIWLTANMFDDGFLLYLLIPFIIRVDFYIFGGQTEYWIGIRAESVLQQRGHVC